MSIHIQLIKTPTKDQTTIYLSKTGKVAGKSFFSASESKIIKDRVKKELEFVSFNRDSYLLGFNHLKKKKDDSSDNYTEQCRKAGFNACKWLNQNKVKDVVIQSDTDETILPFVEGMALSNYQFLKYLKGKKEKENSLKKIQIYNSKLGAKEVEQLNTVIESVFIARDWVNEPLSHLTAQQFAKEMHKLGTASGCKVEVLHKKKIEALKMGGLLAVNKGSIDPPTFSVLTWKPKNAINKSPIILVGKGIVYDTGGLSLKPTPNSMDYMKSDMAGAAMMAGGIIAVAKTKLPIYVIALIPSTDNRPGLNAYVPGDVVKMHNGLTVEVLNTDAEGRMILADALSYASKFKPQLVLDAATLTGAAVAAIGTYASCVMGTADEKEMKSLIKAGDQVYERLAPMPFWDEYGEEMKSDIADLKNLGGRFAGHITAGKFLENFTSYPWIHIDIAGPSFLHSADYYRPKFGTGVGVRLLYEYFKQKVANEK